MEEESQIGMPWIIAAAIIILWFMKTSGSTSAPIPDNFGVTDDSGW